MRHGNTPSAWQQVSSDAANSLEKSAEHEPAPKWCRMFDDLAPEADAGQAGGDGASCGFDDEIIEKLAREMKTFRDTLSEGLNDDVPAGYTYLGQFLIHDITHTVFPDHIDTGLHCAGQPKNMSTASLDLDSVYGNGPEHSPLLYRRRTAPRHEHRYLLRTGITGEPASGQAGLVQGGRPLDLQRIADNPRSGCPHAKNGRHSDPLIGDARNDDHVIISQLHLLFIRSHNRIAEVLKDRGYDGKSSFEIARNYTIKSYRYIIRFDYLHKILDTKIYDEMFSEKPTIVRKNIDKFFSMNGRKIPIEFSMAVGRFGHAMIRPNYKINEKLNEAQQGQIANVLGFSSFGQDQLPLPDDWVVDWRYFFNIDHEIAPQKSRLITPFLSSVLQGIKVSPDNTLALLDLKRSRICGLPSGQQLANRINKIASKKGGKIPVLSGTDLLPNNTRQPKQAKAIAQIFKDHPELTTSTPLFYYILHEADILADGRRLGPLGSFVFAITMNNLMKHEPEWSPEMSPENRPAHICRIRDLIRVPAMSRDDILALPGLDLPAIKN